MKPRLALLVALLGSHGCALVMGYDGYVEEEPITTDTTTTTSHGGGGQGTTGLVASWSYRGGDGDIQSFLGLSLGASGEVLLSGDYQGTIDLFGDVHASPSGLDLLAAKLEKSGKAVWTKGKLDSPPTGSTLLRVATDVVADASGNVMITGGLTSSGGTIDGYLAALDAGTGGELWLIPYDGGGTDASGRLALDSSNRIRLLAESKDKGFTFGSKVIQKGAPSERDLALVTCTNTTCSTNTVTILGGTGDETSSALTADPLPGGAVFVTGNYKGTFDGLADAGAKNGIFVNKYDAAGVKVWARGFVQKQPSTCPETLLEQPTARGTAAFPGGDVVTTGVMCGDTDFGVDGADAPVVLGGKGGADAFVARLAGATGKVVWARALGDASIQMGSAVAVGESDVVYLTGTFAGTLDLGNGHILVSSTSTQRIFLAELSGADGSCLRAAAFGDGEPLLAHRLALAARGGSLVLAGPWTTALDFGAGPLPPGGGLDAFVASFEP